MLVIMNEKQSTRTFELKARVQLNSKTLKKEIGSIVRHKDRGEKLQIYVQAPSNASNAS